MIPRKNLKTKMKIIKFHVIIIQIMKRYFIVVLTTLIGYSLCSNAKTEKRISKIETKNTPPDSVTRILGIWYRDEDRTAYWEFKNDNKVYCYSKIPNSLSMVHSILQLAFFK